MTPGIIIGSVFFACYELFGVKQFFRLSSAHLVNYSWLEINKDSSWDVFPATGLGEEGVEGVVTDSASFFVNRHRTIWLNAMFEAVQLPT